MEGTSTTSFPDLPSEVYDRLFNYLPDRAISNLSLAGARQYERTKSVTSDNYYWLPKLKELLNVPLGRELHLRGLSPEDVYKLYNRIRDRDLAKIFRRMLLGEIVSKDQEDALLAYTVRHNMVSVVKYITGLDFDNGTNYQKMFEYAVDGDLQNTAVEILSTHFEDVDPSYKNNHAVLMAVKFNMLRLLDWLLSNKKVRAVGVGRNVLQAAADSKNRDAINILTNRLNE